MRSPSTDTSSAGRDGLLESATASKSACRCEELESGFPVVALLLPEIDLPIYGQNVAELGIYPN
jgi:hypothetical protein